MTKAYEHIKIDLPMARSLLQQYYGLDGVLTALDGFLDFNFKVVCEDQAYILKISRPKTDEADLRFQNQILEYLADQESDLIAPRLICGKNGHAIHFFEDSNKERRCVRLLSWIDGRLWNQVNPRGDHLMESLGQRAGLLTKALEGFKSNHRRKALEWDLANADWALAHVETDLFEPEQKKLLSYFQKAFREIQPIYSQLRRAIVHNDVNDYNIIVSNDLIDPTVRAIIDFGDSVETQIINDLAIAIAYAVMGKPDPLDAALPLVRGYHRRFPLQAAELQVLFVLVGIRLVISVTMSALSRQREPGNAYLLISEKAAWTLLAKWRKIDSNYACYAFRSACGFIPVPAEEAFKQWASSAELSISELFPGIQFNAVESVNMGIASTWLGMEQAFTDSREMEYRMARMRERCPDSLFAGGYLETRPLYGTPAYKKRGNDGDEYRSVHLGIDFWVPANSAVHAILDAEVVSIVDNGNDRNYGPTLILRHRLDSGLSFFTLYGHLSRSTLSKLWAGQRVKRGEWIATVGDIDENGDWACHLHFQLILDMLDFRADFPGVAFPSQSAVWKSLSPDPNLLFNSPGLRTDESTNESEVLAFRRKHLGRSLSLSYENPLSISRGDGVFLVDRSGRKYLDTVNNVAHVGHEHPRVVRAGQEQMAVLNTNTRYLHPNINCFAERLLATLPKELSVVHMVNSGSEANELALRMARASTGMTDFIAMEVGYHGNSSGCIEISSYKFDGKGGSGAPPHVHIVPLPDAYRGLYRGSGSGKRYAAHVSNIIDSLHAKGRKPAAFICESIISCGGQIELPSDFLKLSYDSVRRAGGICIADEVQVGCGRVGSHFWGFQCHGVIPDIVTIGKPIGNGHPLAAVVCTEAVAEAFANGMEYFNTFGGNPVSAAIGAEVLAVIGDEGLQENARVVGDYLLDRLQALSEQYPIIGDVRGQGLFLGIELVDGKMQALGSHASYLAKRMCELGILMSTDGRDNNVLKIKPPIVFSRENADHLLEFLEMVLKEDFMNTY